MKRLALAALTLISGGVAAFMWTRRSSAAMDKDDAKPTTPTTATKRGVEFEYEIDWDSRRTGGDRIEPGYGRFEDMGMSAPGSRPPWVGHIGTVIHEHAHDPEHAKDWPIGTKVDFTVEAEGHTYRHIARIETHGNVRDPRNVSVFPSEADYEGYQP